MNEQKKKIFIFRDDKYRTGEIAINHWRKSISKYEELTSNKYELIKTTNLS